MSSTSEEEGDPHLFVARRLTAFSARLLDPEDEDTFAAHVASCLQCREVVEAFDADATAPPGENAHIPRSLVARWDRTSVELRGLERQMISAHLDRCEECKSDLRALGFEPALPRETASARSAGQKTISSAVDQTGPLSRYFQKRDTRRIPDWLAWLFGGWALSASVLAGALLFRGGDGQGSAGLDVAAPIVLNEIQRGETPQIHHVPPGRRALVLAFALPVGWRSDTSCRLTVFRPDGTVLGRQHGQIDNFVRPNVLPLVDVPELRSGTYTVLVEPLDEGSRNPIRIPLEIRVSPQSP